MHRSKLLLAAVCAALVPTGALAQQAKPAPQMPRGPVKTPLGKQSAEVLLSKIVVSDLAKSYQFYTKVIGLKRAYPEGIPLPPEPAPLAPGTPEPAFIEVALNFSGSLGDAFFDITTKRGVKPTREAAALAQVGFKVPDAPAVIARAKAAGFEVITEAPKVGPGEMSIGMIRDPDGYQVEIIQAANYVGKK